MARYSRSSSAVRLTGGATSGCSSTSTRSDPSRPGWAAPATPRCRPRSATARGAAGQPDALDHLGDDADGGVVGAVARDQEDLGRPFPTSIGRVACM